MEESSNLSSNEEESSRYENPNDNDNNNSINPVNYEAYYDLEEDEDYDDDNYNWYQFIAQDDDNYNCSPQEDEEEAINELAAFALLALEADYQACIQAGSRRDDHLLLGEEGSFREERDYDGMDDKSDDESDGNLEVEEEQGCTSEQDCNDRVSRDMDVNVSAVRNAIQNIRLRHPKLSLPLDQQAADILALKVGANDPIKNFLAMDEVQLLPPQLFKIGLK